MKIGGYQRRLLRINLTEKSFKIEPIDMRILEKIVGGLGLAAYYMLKEMTGKEKPLGIDNKLFFANGPLTGTIAPTSSRFGVYTKSPQTGAFLESSCGGDFGKELKYAGYDLLIIEGRSENLTYLEIKDDDVRFHDASILQKCSLGEILLFFDQTYGEEWANICIGPAGERLSPLAGIFSGLRTAGRGGSGAVMGSKNLKGVVINGTQKVSIAHPEKFEEYVHLVFRDLRNSNPVSALKKQGTVNILKLINSAGALPVRNYQFKSSKKALQFYGEMWEKHWVKRIACFNCPISCSKISKFKIGDKEKGVDGPEYETIWSLGVNCEIYDFEIIKHANYLCDEYGIDTISTGNIIGFVMELYEKGILTAEDLDGIKARWGDKGALLELTEKICTGNGIGALLEKGVKKITKEIGQGQEFSMHVKGLEMPAFHPGGNYGIALGYAVSSRGACHLHGAPLSELFGGAEPSKSEGKVEMLLKQESLCNIINSASLCYFVLNGINLKNIYLMLTTATGLQISSPAYLEKIGISISAMTKLFNSKCNISRKTDWLPERVFIKGINRKKFKDMLNQYYAILEKYKFINL